jgi:tetratricopeptide (TPR) repeat protein
VGKASRRKRERLQTAANAQPAIGVRSGNEKRGSRQSLLIIGALVIVLAAMGLALWSGNRNQEMQAEPAVLLPDPDTSGMTAPVARVIREARRKAVAQPQSAAASGYYGQVLQAHWLNDAAAASYGIAHQLDPGEFRWAYLLAGVEELRGADNDRIDSLFRQAIRLAPDFPPVYVRHADALLRMGRWPEALEGYARAVELDPDLLLGHRGLGQAAILMGNGTLAVKHLERAASLNPGDRITQATLARAYALTGEGDKADEAAQKAKTLRSEAGLPDPVFFEVQNLAVDPETLRRRIAGSLRKGDEETALEAISLLEESGYPEIRSQLAGNSKQRAMQFAMKGDFNAALAEFERASLFAPEDPEIEHNWGTVLLRQGNLEAAADHFEKAIQLNPRSADSLYNLGVVLEGLGHTDQAIVRFTEAAAIDPQHMAAQRLSELGALP